MRRLAVILLVLALVLAGPAAAQSPDARIYRLGQLAPSEASLTFTRERMSELARLGYAEGRNLVILSRTGDAARLPAEARELLREGVDAILTVGTEATRAARDATTTVPIIMFGSDPVGQGFAASLSRPGGNVTGVTILGAELDGKRLDLLRETLPSARRFAALLPSRSPGRATSEREMRSVATQTGIELLIFEVAEPADYPGAFAAMRSAGAQGLVIGAYATFFRDMQQLIALADQAGLPTACEWPDMARMGCVLGYGPDRAELRRRLADYVARIFRGAPPSELPLEAPAVFALAVNLQAARSLALAVPPALLVRADEVIE